MNASSSKDPKSIGKTIEDNIENTFESLCSLWNEMGYYQDDKRDQFREQLYTHCLNAVNEYLKDVYNEEETAKQSLAKSIQEKEEAVTDLCIKMGYNHETVWINELGEDIRANKTLRSKSELVHSLLEHLNAIYIEAHDESTALLNSLNELYMELEFTGNENLGEPDDYLTIDKLALLRKILDHAIDVKNKRLASMKLIARDLELEYNSLGITLENADEVDRRILMNMDNFPVSYTMLNELVSRQTSIKQLKEQRIEEIGEERATIEGLWSLLGTPTEEIEQFLSMYSTIITNDSLRAHKEYRAKLQGQVQIQLVSLINAEREKIDQLIKGISQFTSVLDNQDFSVLSIPEEQYDMDVFNQTKALYTELLHRNEELQSVLDLINQRDRLLAMKEDLAERRKDSSRLTNPNYGFKELHKERQMEVTVARLPSVIKELKRAIEVYESKNGSIIVNGVRLYDTLIDIPVQPRKSVYCAK